MAHRDKTMPQDNTDFSLILTTAGSADAARALAEHLVADGLAACVQLLPIHSVYRWQGAVQHDAETLLLVKTRTALYAEVEACIRRQHSYSVPEVLCLPVCAGSVPYLDWLAAMTRSPG